MAEALNVSKAEVHGCITFYHDFRAGPAGRRVVKLCRAEACQAVGAEAMHAEVLRWLGIDWHGTTRRAHEPPLRLAGPLLRGGLFSDAHRPDPRRGGVTPMSATSSTDKLVRMANQIATFFRSYPEEEAVAGIRKHLVAYWTPTMRARLEAHAPQAGGRLDPLVVAAIAHPAAVPSPVRSATSDPHRLGEGASDAG